MLNFGLVLAIGLSLAACDLTDVKKTDDEAAQPAIAATVVGIWRSDIAITNTNPPTILKLTMQVNADQTLLISQRLPTGQPAPYDNVEIAKENFSWKIENGALVAVKTTCKYNNPETMQPTGETDCRAPLSRTDNINVKGKLWTVIESGQPMVFRKD